MTSMKKSELSLDEIELEKEKLKLEEDIEQEKKEDRRRYVVYILVLLLLMFFATFGITYTLYTGDSGENSQEIITNKIIFAYSDVNRKGSGIQIENAIPLADAVGKKQSGKNEYFDFSITATSTGSKLHYKLLINKDKTSTLENKNVRIYLTSVTGNLEKELVLKTFSELKQERFNGINYYVLYDKVLDKGIVDYSDFYRLRMWVDENATNYEAKRFALKVDVIAEQMGD